MTIQNRFLIQFISLSMVLFCAMISVAAFENEQKINELHRPEKRAPVNVIPEELRVMSRDADLLSGVRELSAAAFKEQVTLQADTYAQLLAAHDLDLRLEVIGSIAIESSLSEGLSFFSALQVNGVGLDRLSFVIAPEVATSTEPTYRILLSRRRI